MAATGRIAATAGISLLYSPVGANMHSYKMHDSLGPCESDPTNGISICSFVFAGFTVVTNIEIHRHTYRPRHFVCSNRPYLCYARDAGKQLKVVIIYAVTKNISHTLI